MDIRKVKKLIELLETSDVNEIEIKEGDQSVRISRGTNTVVHTQPTVIAGPPAATPEPAAPVATTTDGHEPVAAALTEHVRSPMVGTFYAAPSPGSAVFIAVGQTVAEDEVLCLIEAMKTMNEIKAPVAGEVTKIYPKNGDPIQYNQALVEIKKA